MLWILMHFAARSKNMVRFESEEGPQGGFLYLHKREWIAEGEPKNALVQFIAMSDDEPEKVRHDA